MPEQETPTGGDDGFKAITSQEELNKVLSGRLDRERAKFADYDDLRAKAAEFDKVAEASKTELQKAIDRAAALESELGGYKQREQVSQWVAEIVKDSPVPADALRGSTREELEAHHAQLAALLTSATKPAASPKKATPPGKAPQERGEPRRAAAALRALRNG